MDTADADAYLGMAAEMDQGVLRPGPAAAPAPALACLVCACLSLSAHDGLPSVSSECRRPAAGRLRAFPMTEANRRAHPRPCDRVKSWTEAPAETGVISAITAKVCGIGAGSAPAAPGRAIFIRWFRVRVPDALRMDFMVGPWPGAGRRVGRCG